MSTEIVDAEVADAPPETEATHGVELVAAPVRSAVIAGWQPSDVVSNASQVAKTLNDMIQQQGLSVHVGGKKKHVEVGAWQACGHLLGALGGQPLHAETVWSRPVVGPDGTLITHEYAQHIKRYHKGGGLREEVTFDVCGHDWEARVDIKTLDGSVVATAEAQCSRSEETWSRREDFALRSMAETRAESRAYRRAIGWIVSMAGYAATPAEEMGHDATRVEAGPPFGPAIKADDRAEMVRLISLVAGVDEDEAKRIGGMIAALTGNNGERYMPEIVLRALAVISAAQVPADADVDPAEAAA